MQPVMDQAVHMEGDFMQMNIVGMQNGLHNQINLRVGGSLPGRRHADAVGTGNMSVPQCRVTISREGRMLSERMKAKEPGSFTAAGTERLLLRQQKQAEMNRREQSDTLSEISGMMSEIRSSYAAGEDKETIAEKQDALNRLLDLKAKQEEENEQRIKDATDSAAGASREQEEIDRKNADLYLMLKTLEEKDEEERAGGADAQEAADDADDGSAGESFQDSASMLGVSAVERELQVVGMIDGMFDEGYGRLAQADAMMHEVQAELGLAAEALGRAELSEAERNQLMSEHIGRASNMMRSNYGEMMDLQRKGHQQIRDARELEQKHIADSPLDGLARAKQTILEAGAASALREVSQDTVDKASAELEKKVQEEIDKRNNAVSGTDEEQERAETLEEQIEEKRLEEEALEQEEHEKAEK